MSEKACTVHLDQDSDPWQCPDCGGVSLFYLHPGVIKCASCGSEWVLDDPEDAEPPF